MTRGCITKCHQAQRHVANQMKESKLDRNLMMYFHHLSIVVIYMF